MSVVFADTSYFIALVGEDDDAHELAIGRTATFKGRIVTTGWVLMEVANHLAEPQNRQVFLDLLDDLRADSRVSIVPATESAFGEGVHLYRQRMDQAWSLVDCISFLVMRAEGITEALTGDHHFEQAGFVALLKP